MTASVSDSTAPAPAAGPPDLHTVEEFLCTVWQELLGAAGDLADSDFFALGGHSFLAIEVIGRLQDTFQLEVPFWLIFECPTPRQLADRVVNFEGE